MPGLPGIAPGQHGRTVLSFGVRCVLLAAVLLGALLGLLLQPPLRQDLGYHAFADRRTLLGIPNALDVLTSLPFLWVGSAGLRYCLRHPQALAPRSWQAFFAGVALVGLGSAWYHLEPSSQRLIWDRLPMAIAFMGVLVALLAEHTTPRMERYFLWPALAIGVGSVAWWAYADDLRLYGWVQLAPLLTIPIAMTLFPGRYTHRSYLLAAGACYGVAKGAELLDAAVLRFTGGFLGGHSLKHLLAALGVGVLYLMLRRRRWRWGDLDRVESAEARGRGRIP